MGGLWFYMSVLQKDVCCLLGPLTHHPSCHLLEQPNPAQCTVSSPHQGSLPGRQNPSPPFPWGVPLVQGGRRAEERSQAFWDSFSQGWAVVNQKARMAVGSQLCLTCCCARPCAWLQTDRKTDRQTLVTTSACWDWSRDSCLFPSLTLPMPSSPASRGAMGRSGHGAADVGAAGEWCRVSQSPPLEAGGNILHRTARNGSQLGLCLCFPLPGTHAAWAARGALEYNS